MQGPSARERDVEKGEAVAIAVDGLKDERNFFSLILELTWRNR